MTGLNIKSNENEILISLKKSELNNKNYKDFIKEIYNFIRFQQLSDKAEFDESILNFAEEVKEEWSKKYGKDFLKEIEDSN